MGPNPLFSSAREEMTSVKLGLRLFFPKFRQGLDKIRDKGEVPVVCGALPGRGAGAEWLSVTITGNRRLADHCNSNGWTFIE